MLTTYIVPDSKIQKILDWLSPLNMYQKQQDTLSRRQGTTGSWLWNDSVSRNGLIVVTRTVRYGAQGTVSAVLALYIQY